MLFHTAMRCVRKLAEGQAWGRLQHAWVYLLESSLPAASELYLEIGLVVVPIQEAL